VGLPDKVLSMGVFSAIAMNASGLTWLVDTRLLRSLLKVPRVRCLATGRCPAQKTVCAAHQWLPPCRAPALNRCDIFDDLGS